MNSGNVYIRGGEYYSYFGLETTYGIYADGGYMEVEGGAFSVIDGGTCISCNYNAVSDDEYLYIAGGSFTSQWGDTVQVNGGKLSLRGGEFKMDASQASNNQTDSAILRVTGGVLDGANATGLEFSLTGSQIYGIYAGGNVTLENATFGFSDGGTNNIGVYADGGNVTLGGTTTITNADLGIYVKSGSVECSSELALTSNAGAIRIEGGSFTVQEYATVNIESGKSYDNQNTDWGYDSVYVSGGSFLSYGSLNITHTGVNNEDQYNGSNANSLYKDFVVKSYAVRVEAGESSSQVVIQKGTITNNCGGGVYIDVGSTDSVTLGYEDNMDDEDLVIKTTGNTLMGDYISITGGNDNWRYRQSLNGGQAVRVNGGELNIYGGTYSSAQGDGILVSNGSNGTVEIIGGKFNGNDAYGTVAGPAASYSFKLYGGTATVYGGTFGEESSGSGAFIMGNSEDDRGKATILGGTFVVSGQAGFSIFSYADVTFGSEDSSGTSEIKVSGNAAGIAIENHAEAANIVIYAGDFSSTGPSGNYDGVWYSNVNATLTIYGGTFYGSARSGLYFAVGPNGNVQLYGGTFTGTTSAISANVTVSVSDILPTGYEMIAGNGTIITSGYVNSTVANHTEITVQST